MLSASDEVVISGRRCINGVGPGFVRANRTLESAQNQTLRAQSGGITGTQLLSALKAGWHLDKSRRGDFTPVPQRCNLQRRDSLFVVGETDPDRRPIEKPERRFT